MNLASDFIGGGLPSTSSDVRLKENITDAPSGNINALKAKVAALEGA